MSFLLNILFLSFYYVFLYGLIFMFWSLNCVLEGICARSIVFQKWHATIPRILWEGGRAIETSPTFPRILWEGGRAIETSPTIPRILWEGGRAIETSPTVRRILWEGGRAIETSRYKTRLMNSFSWFSCWDKLFPAILILSSKERYLISTFFLFFNNSVFYVLIHTMYFLKSRNGSDQLFIYRGIDTRQIVYKVPLTADPNPFRDAHCISVTLFVVFNSTAILDSESNFYILSFPNNVMVVFPWCLPGQYSVTIYLTWNVSEPFFSCHAFFLKQINLFNAFWNLGMFLTSLSITFFFVF